MKKMILIALGGFMSLHAMENGEFDNGQIKNEVNNFVQEACLNNACAKLIQSYIAAKINASKTGSLSNYLINIYKIQHLKQKMGNGALIEIEDLPRENYTSVAWLKNNCDYFPTISTLTAHTLHSWDQQARIQSQIEVNQQLIADGDLQAIESAQSNLLIKQ